MFNGKYLDWNQKRIKAIIDHFGHQFMFQKKILDLGCGHGDISGSLYRLGADVTAVDVRQEHLKITGKKFSGIKTIKADLDSSWPFIGKSFDIILDLDLMCHLFDYEAHLKAVCSSTNHLVLETAVCDSEDSFKNVIIEENKNIYDLSGNGRGCRPSAAAIERVLRENGFSFVRLDKAKLNSGTFTYTWIPKNNGSHSDNQRRMWFAVKEKDLQVNTTPSLTETNNLPFNIRGNQINPLQNSHILVPGLLSQSNKDLVIPPEENTKKIKLALCISGHLRTFESNYKTVKEQILDKFNCDVFIHTWNTLGLSYRPGDSNLHVADTNRYLSTIKNLYQPKKIVIEEAKQFEMTTIMNTVDYSHRDRHGILSMFYKIEECNNLRKEYEKESNVKYDFVVRFRGDLWMEGSLPIDSRTAHNHLYLPVYGNFGGACDQIAFGSPNVMDRYSNIYSNVEYILNSARTWNPELMLLFHLETQHLPIAKVPIKFLIRRANGLVQDNMLLERAWGMVK